MGCNKRIKKAFRKMSAGGGVNPADIAGMYAQQTQYMNQAGAAGAQAVGWDAQPDEYGIVDPKEAAMQSGMSNLGYGPFGIMMAEQTRKNTIESNQKIRGQMAVDAGWNQLGQQGILPGQDQYTQMMPEGGQVGAETVELEQGEPYKLPDGTIESIPTTAPTHKQGGVDITLPTGSKILGKKKAMNGKEFKKMGRKLEKLQNKYQEYMDTRPTSIEARTAKRMLGNINKEYEQLFQEQGEDVGGRMMPEGGQVNSKKVNRIKKYWSKSDLDYLKKMQAPATNRKGEDISNSEYWLPSDITGRGALAGLAASIPGFTPGFAQTGDPFGPASPEFKQAIDELVSEKGQKFPDGGRVAPNINAYKHQSRVQPTVPIQQQRDPNLMYKGDPRIQSYGYTDEKYNMAQQGDMLGRSPFYNQGTQELLGYREQRKGMPVMNTFLNQGMYQDTPVMDPSRKRFSGSEVPKLSKGGKIRKGQSGLQTGPVTPIRGYIDPTMRYPQFADPLGGQIPNELSHANVYPHDYSEDDYFDEVAVNFGSRQMPSSRSGAIPNNFAQSNPRLSNRARNRYPTEEEYGMEPWMGNSKSWLPQSSVNTSGFGMPNDYSFGMSDPYDPTAKFAPELNTSGADPLGGIDPRVAGMKHNRFTPYDVNPSGSKSGNVTEGNEFDYMGAANTLGSLASTAYNISQGLKPADEVRESQFRNPYAEGARNLMRRRKYDVSPELERSALNAATSRRYAREMGLSRGQQLGASQAAAIGQRRGEAQTFSRAQQINNQYLAQQAAMDYRVGSDISRNRFAVEDINERERAARRAYMAQGYGQLGQYSQSQQLMRNQALRDEQRMALIPSLVQNFTFDPDAGDWVHNKTGKKYTQDEALDYSEKYINR